MTMPNQDVIHAIEAGITRVTRRVEFYEADGVTPFYPNGSEEDTSRLVGGGVSVDSSRDERRSIDLVADNRDGKMRPNSESGFWYDKIVVPYRGVRYASKRYTPRVLIVGAPSVSAAALWKGIFSQLGFNRVDINLNATNLSHLAGYSIIAEFGGANAIAKSSLLISAFSAGFDIFTQGLKNGTQLPYVVSTAPFTAAAPVYITPVLLDTPLAGGWSTEAEGSGVGVGIVSLASDAVGIATSLNDSVTHYTASLKQTEGARWFDYKPNIVGTQAKSLLSKALYWLWDYSPQTNWETPLGTFLIDNMKTQNFPNQLSLSGRDLTKRCLNSKIERNLSFDSTTSLKDFVTALAANAGIKKMRLEKLTGQIGVDIDATRTTERWALMSQAATSRQFDLFFDIEGFLTAEPWADVTLGSPVASFRVGKSGNLASYDRSTEDSRIYNHVIVTGTPNGDDPTAVGYFGEAANDSQDSPTSRSRIGDRTYFYTSSFFTSDAQCQNHADQLLGQIGFEQYSLDLASFVYPWMDAGVVIDFDDPDKVELDPTRFLATSLTVPLELSTMPVSAKRIIRIEGEDQEDVTVAEEDEGA